MLTSAAKSCHRFCSNSAS